MTTFDQVTAASDRGRGFLPIIARYTMHTTSLTSLLLNRPPNLTNQDIHANVTLAQQVLTELNNNNPAVTETTTQTIREFAVASSEILRRLLQIYPLNNGEPTADLPTAELKKLAEQQWRLYAALDIEMLAFDPAGTDAGKTP